MTHSPSPAPILTQRLFLGIELPPGLQQSLAALQTEVAGARWQSPDDLHLTLRFLGEVDQPRRRLLDTCMRRLCVPGFLLQLRGVGQFDQTVLWASLAPSERLLALKSALDDQLQTADWQPETRAFVPHVTLARCGGNAAALQRFVKEHAQLQSAPWPVTHVSLFTSDPRLESQRYRVIERYPLLP